jgi:hypothetical protein
MVYLQTKNPNLGKFWRVLQWKGLVHFMAIWSNLLTFGIFVDIWYFCGLLVYFVANGNIFGMLYQEKSGNPVVALSAKPIMCNHLYL